MVMDIYAIAGAAGYRRSKEFQLNQHGRYFIMDNSWERSGTVGFRCVADSVITKNSKPYNWNGTGNYCIDRNGYDSVTLCASIQPPKGYNNLTTIGIPRTESATKIIPAYIINFSVLGTSINF